MTFIKELQQENRKIFADSKDVFDFGGMSSAQIVSAMHLVNFLTTRTALRTIEEVLKKLDTDCGRGFDTECEHGINPAWECKNRRCEERMFWACRKVVSDTLSHLEAEIKKQV